MSLFIIGPGNFSIQYTAANPVPSPKNFDSMTVGVFDINQNLSMVSGNVQIDVYDEYSLGKGTYHIVNHENQTVNASLIFTAGHNSEHSRDEEELQEQITSFKVNGSEILPVEICYLEYPDYYVDEFNYSAIQVGGAYNIYNFTVQPLEKCNVEISWRTDTALIENYTYDNSPIIENRKIYWTGYLINGGRFWNNQPIQAETVRFIFHTDTYFIDSDHNIAINNENPYETVSNLYDSAGWLEHWQSKVENATKSPTCVVDNQTIYEVTYTDIMDNIFINIINDNSTIIEKQQRKRIDGFTPNLLFIAGATMVWYIVDEKRYLSGKPE